MLKMKPPLGRNMRLHGPCFGFQIKLFWPSWIIELLDKLGYYIVNANTSIWHQISLNLIFLYSWSSKTKEATLPRYDLKLHHLITTNIEPVVGRRILGARGAFRLAPLD